MKFRYILKYNCSLVKLQNLSSYVYPAFIFQQTSVCHKPARIKRSILKCGSWKLNLNVLKKMSKNEITVHNRSSDPLATLTKTNHFIGGALAKEIDFVKTHHVVVSFFVVAARRPFCQHLQLEKCDKLISVNAQAFYIQASRLSSFIRSVTRKLFPKFPTK